MNQNIPLSNSNCCWNCMSLFHPWSTSSPVSVWHIMLVLNLLSGSVRLYPPLVVLLLCVRQTEHCPRGAVWRSLSQQTCHRWCKLILIIKASYSVPRWEGRHFYSNKVWHTRNTKQPFTPKKKKHWKQSNLLREHFILNTACVLYMCASYDELLWRFSL